MALIICKECGKEVSDTCEKCPNCGADIQKQVYETLSPEEKAKVGRRTLGTWAAVIGGLIFLANAGGEISVLELGYGWDRTDTWSVIWMGVGLIILIFGIYKIKH